MQQHEHARCATAPPCGHSCTIVQPAARSVGGSRCAPSGAEHPPPAASVAMPPSLPPSLHAPATPMPRGAPALRAVLAAGGAGRAAPCSDSSREQEQATTLGRMLARASRRFVCGPDLLACKLGSQPGARPATAGATGRSAGRRTPNWWPPEGPITTVIMIMLMMMTETIMSVLTAFMRLGPRHGTHEVGRQQQHR
eukprot:scaffold1180_cov321-Prasinococcus_capsulatus_cf.AAC.7